VLKYENEEEKQIGVTSKYQQLVMYSDGLGYPPNPQLYKAILQLLPSHMSEGVEVLRE